MARAVALMLVLTVVALSIVAAPPAYSDSAKAGSGQSSDGSAQISVSVSYESASSGSGGGGGVATSSQTVTATVQPICYHEARWTGKSLAEDINSDNNFMYYEDDSDPDTDYANWKDHATDEEGLWYIPTCSRKNGQSPEELDAAARAFFPTAHAVFVPAGGEPPAPYIDGGTLAKAAWDAVTIPQPGVETNPKLGDSGATLVGIDTWVWATEDTPAKVTATATAGPATATVTAVSDGLRLSTPDSEPNCQGFSAPPGPREQERGRLTARSSSPAPQPTWAGPRPWTSQWATRCPTPPPTAPPETWAP